MAVVINGSTGIATPDGSAGVPSLAGTTSSTAGVLYPAADVVAISTNSIERLRVPSTGGLQFNGSSSGGTVVQASATASGTLTLPASTGTLAITTSPVFTTPAIIGSSTGYTTLASANTSATNYTLTFPAKTGNIITSADSGTVTGTMLASATVTGTNIASATVAQSNLATNVAGNGPAFSASPTTAQSVTSATYTKVTLGTVQFDTNSNFSSSRFTPTVAGYYQINGSLYAVSSSSANYIWSIIYKNGNIAAYGSSAGPASAVDGSSVVVGLIYLNGSTDYVEFYCYLSGTSPAIQSTGTLFTGSLVRSA